MYEAKLAWQFPARPCTVSLYVADDQEDLLAHEVTSWQKGHSRTDTI
jgi:hypothetical protein